MKLKGKNLVILAALAAVMVLGLSPVAEAIRLRPEGQTGSDLRASIQASKAIYRVGEPIRFRVWANQDFFLYIISLDESGRPLELLYPNVHEGGFRFTGRMTHTLPDRSWEFFADEPGVERIVAVASTTRVDLNRGKSGGDWASYPAEEVYKAIRVRPRGAVQQVASELRLTITGR